MGNKHIQLRFAILLAVGVVACVESAPADAQGLLRRLGNQIRSRRAQMYRPPAQPSRVPQYRVPQNQPQLPQTPSQLRAGENPTPNLVPATDPASSDEKGSEESASTAKPRPTLGIIVRDVPDKEAVEVVQFKDHSKADEAGLKLGDLIFGINAKPTPSIRALANELTGRSAGQEVRLRIQRDKRMGDLVVPLVELPQSRLAKAQKTAPSPDSSSVKPAVALEPKGKAALGIEVETLAGSRGAVVRVIQPNSPAQKAGLKIGDRIVSMDGRMIATSTALADEISKRSPGQAVAIQLVRGNQLFASRLLLASVVSQASAVAEASAAEKTKQPNTKSSKEDMKSKFADSGKSILEGIGLTPPANSPSTKPAPPEPKAQTPKVADSVATNEPDPFEDPFEFDLGDDAPIDSEVFGPVATEEFAPRE